MLPRENLHKDDFDKFYEKIDPWGINENLVIEILISSLNHQFKNQIFQKGLDLGCGEGTVTSQLHFVKDWTGLDISEVAITRAKAKNPEIKFLVMDINDLSQMNSSRYDFILCLETIYYLSSEQRLKFLKSVKNLGTDSAQYCFSLVVSGPSKFREYPTFDEAYKLLSEFFVIEQVLPISVKDLKVPRIVQYFLKVENLLQQTSLRKFFYIKCLKATNIQSVHQALFILRAH